LRHSRDSASSRRAVVQRVILGAGLIGAVISGVWAYHAHGPYGEGLDIDPRVRRIYDASGRLTMIGADLNGNLRLETWSYMDGERLVRIDTDTNEDGTIDRRKFYNDALEIERIETLNARGRVVRREFYDHDVLTRTEYVDETTGGTIPGK
jgi:hypothetical protein